MKTRLPAVVVLLVVMLVQPLLVRAQSTRAGQDWNAVRSLAIPSELQIRLKNGKSHKGRFVSASDTELVLSERSSFRTIAQNDVRRLYVVVPNRRSDTAAKGAAIGSLLAFAGVKGITDESGDGLGTAQTMIALGLLGAGIGALAGLVAARPHKRILVYEAR